MNERSVNFNRDDLYSCGRMPVPEKGSNKELVLITGQETQELIKTLQEGEGLKYIVEGNNVKICKA